MNLDLLNVVFPTGELIHVHRPMISISGIDQTVRPPLCSDDESIFIFPQNVETLQAHELAPHIHLRWRACFNTAETKRAAVSPIPAKPSAAGTD